jgi:hypothetical protein
MPETPRRSWLSFLLFWLTLAVSAALVLLVIVAPLVDNRESHPDGWARLFSVFAEDAVLQRTAVASALGLAVTACVFFRRPGGSAGKGPKPPPPANIAGA